MSLEDARLHESATEEERVVIHRLCTWLDSFDPVVSNDGREVDDLDVLGVVDTNRRHWLASPQAGKDG